MTHLIAAGARTHTLPGAHTPTPHTTCGNGQFWQNTLYRRPSCDAIAAGAGRVVVVSTSAWSLLATMTALIRGSSRVDLEEEQGTGGA
jgi:hypothetical protein